MVTVFLCDDSQKYIEKFSKVLTDIAKKHHIEITLSVFESGEELLFHLAETSNLPDIIYMDVLMGDENGIVTAKHLREQGSNAEIIFLSVSGDYVFDAFDILPVHYLLKETTTLEKHEEVFLKAVKMSQSKNTEMFICESGHASKVIPIKDISYFEIWKRVVEVHYGDGNTFKFYETMEQLENKLIDKNFIRTHRSYLVNLPYVTKFQPQNLSLKTGEVIPIGITYAKEVKEAFLNYVIQYKVHST